jgi:hypothetical protein
MWHREEVAMCAREAKGKNKEEAKVEWPQGFAEMCRQMMSGGMPDCCGPEMRGIMSRFMARFQAEAKK